MITISGDFETSVTDLSKETKEEMTQDGSKLLEKALIPINYLGVKLEGDFNSGP